MSECASGTMEAYKLRKKQLKAANNSLTTKNLVEDRNPGSSCLKRRDGLSPQFSRAKSSHHKGHWKGPRQRLQNEKCPISKHRCVSLEGEPPTDITIAGLTSKNKSKPNAHRAGNELLNFSYNTPRTRNVHDGPINRRQRYNSSNDAKEVFLQANCRFVVRHNEDYSKHTSDPDLLVNWDWIEQVCLCDSEIPNCPICLYPPTVARITRCGHVYCFSCINHYLKLGTKNHRKCPICLHDVYQDDLKSVVTKSRPTFSPGDKVTMTLMRRSKGSVIARPATKNGDFSFQLGESVFSKLMLATCQEVLVNIVLPEKMILASQLEDARANKSGEEPFIELALATLTQKEAVLMQHATELTRDNQSEPQPLCQVTDSDGTCQITGTDPGIANRGDRDEAADGKNGYFYFYQASDGQNLFIHPINVRCLMREYGSFEMCPPTITASIIATETISVTPETRKKYRYLSHLPIACEFTICELMLKAPDVSKETLLAFADEFRKRKQQRQQKRREEKKNERKYEAGLRFDNHGRVCNSRTDLQFVKFNSLVEFPFQPVDYRSAASDEDNTAIGHHDSSQILQNSCEQSLHAVSESNPCLSFAEALGKPASVTATAAWPPIHRQLQNLAQASTACDSLDEDTIETSVPSFAEAFSTALALSLPTAINQSDSNPSDRSAAPNRKQKKRNKQVLFSTGNMRKY